MQGLKARLAIAIGMCALIVCLAGCGGGFFNPSSSGTGSGGGSGGGSGSGSGLSSVYVANSNPSLLSVSAYSLASAGTLTNLANSPSVLGILPTTMAINPAGTLLWVGSLFQGVFVYVINADGSLSLGASNAAVSQISASSMAVDPTGNYLLVLSSTGTGSAPVVYVYQINQTNGVLTAVTENGNPYVPLDIGTAAQIAFAPNGTQVFATLGTGGVDVLSFSPSNGGLGKLNVLLQPLGNSYADQGVTVDPASKFLFVTETGTNGVRVLSIGTTGTLTSVAGSPYPTGLGANAVLVDTTGSYIYVANSSTNTISAFGLSSTGTLTPIAGSPFTTGSSPYSLTEDSSGTYLISANLGGTPDLQVFAITPATGTTPGALTPVSTASTGSVSPSGAISAIATP